MPIDSLPIELWEEIIDFCSVDEYGIQGGLVERQTLLACALTCKTWRTRSLYNLYQMLTLRGDTKTRDVTRAIKNQPDLALRVYHVRNWSSTGPEPDDKCTTFYLVPLYLTGVPPSTLPIHTVDFFRSPTTHHVHFGPGLHDSFFKAWSIHRSVQTLHLQRIEFGDFPHFCRLVIGFSQLQHLTLRDISFERRTRHPPSIASKKRFKLKTLETRLVDPVQLDMLIPWLVKSRALEKLEALKMFIGEKLGSEIDLGDRISRMVLSAGKSLKHLEISNRRVSRHLDLHVDCSANTSLESLTLHWFPSPALISTLSTLSESPIITTATLTSLHTLTFTGVLISSYTDVDNLFALLTSRPFSPLSLPTSNLESIKIGFSPMERWISAHNQILEDVMNEVEFEVEERAKKVRSILGRKIEIEVQW